MEALLGIAVVTTLLMKVWSTARIDHEFAKQGKPSPRMQAKYGQAEAARKVAKYGFADYLRDAWNDYWPRRTDALIAARNAKAANPGERVSLRQRLRAGMDAVDNAVKATYARATTKPESKLPKVERRPVEPVAPTAVESGDVPAGTVRFEDGRRQQWTGTEWVDAPAKPTSTPPVAPAANPATEGTPQMSAPTGETTTFNNTVPQMAALRQEIANQRDQADAARRMVQQVDGLADVLEARQRQIAQSAQSMGEHLQVRNLDPATLSGVQQTVEALSPNDVDQMLEACEVLKAKLDKVIAGADAGHAAIDTTQRHVVGTYADAASVVEERLRGDARFLNSDDAGRSAPSSPQPANEPVVEATPVPDGVSEELYGASPAGQPARFNGDRSRAADNLTVNR